MTKNSPAVRLTSTSSVIWKDGFSVNQRQLSTNWRLTLAPYYCPGGTSSADLAGICPPLSFIGTLVLNVFAVFVLFPLPLYSIAAVILVAVAPIPFIFVFLRWRMFRLTNYHNEARGTVLRLLTSKSDASPYQHWLVLHRLKTKGLIDPHRMEPFEDGFPTSRYLFSVVYPLAAVLPVEFLTVDSTKLSVACNCI